MNQLLNICMNYEMSNFDSQGNINNLCLATTSRRVNRPGYRHFSHLPADRFFLFKSNFHDWAVPDPDQGGHWYVPVWVVSKPALQLCVSHLPLREGKPARIAVSPQFRLEEGGDGTDSDLREMFRPQGSSRYRGQGWLRDKYWYFVIQQVGRHHCEHNLQTSEVFKNI